MYMCMSEMYNLSVDMKNMRGGPQFKDAVHILDNQELTD